MKVEARLSPPARRPVRGHLHDVAPTAFVQMIAIERETCALDVRAEGRQGVLFFVEGDLCDAVLDDLRGEEAAIAILGWDVADVETHSIAESPRRSINAPLTFVLLEAMRRKDELSSAPPRAASPAAATLVQTLARELDGLVGLALLDFLTGLPVEEHFPAALAFEPAGARQACLDLARAELALLTGLGLRSTPEDLVLSFGDFLLFLRFTQPRRLLMLFADPARTGIPAIQSALRRLAPAYPSELAPWLA